MNKIILLVMLLVNSYCQAAGVYDGLNISTTTGKAVRNISGTLGVAASSTTYSTYTITLDGTSGYEQYDTDFVKFLQISSGSITGLDGNPIYYKMRFYPRSSVTNEEHASIYLKIDPSGSTTNQQVGIFGEVTSEQQDTEAAFMKVVHKGAGDAIYVPMWTNAGVAFEAASFGNGTKGIISTLQTSDCFYTTLFTGLWAQSTVPGYGALYLDDMPGNAITVRVMSGAATSQSTIRVVSTDLGTDYFKINNDGSVVSLSTITATYINTGNGDNELYAMDQNVRTTDSPTYSALTLSGHSFTIGGSDYNLVMSTSGSSVNFAFGKSVSSTTVPIDIQADPTSGYLVMYRRQSSPQYWYAWQMGGTSLALRNYGDSGTSKYLFSPEGYFTTSGRIGIGTTSPSYPLDIVANGINTYWGPSGTKGILAANSGTDIVIGSYTNHPLKLKINNTTALTISTSQYIGIGTESPITLLHVKGSTSYGSIKVSPSSDDSESAIGFMRDAAGTDNSHAWAIGRNIWGLTGNIFGIGNENGGSTGIVKMVITIGGYVGIGTTSPAYKTHISSGTLYVDGTSAKIETTGTIVATSSGTFGGVEITGSGVGYKFADGTVQTTAATGITTLAWERVSNDCGSAATCTATCSAGKKVLGGGCSYNVTCYGAGYPDTDSTYTCGISNTQQLTAYALCGDVD